MFAGALAIAIRLLLLPVLPIPVPQVHDEFSYLLGAETFASGRITNPPHPMWVHFETFHVNMQPTYHSKYMPAQSLFLAFGLRVFGHPWFGVCLAMGLMYAAFCWMLYGWVAPPYAMAATWSVGDSGGRRNGSLRRMASSRPGSCGAGLGLRRLCRGNCRGGAHRAADA